MEQKAFSQLIKLYNISAESNHEQEMIKHCISIFKEAGCYVKNKNNNLYITKGKLEEGEYYPCIAAHLDEVHKTNQRGKHIVYKDIVNDILFGWSLDNCEQCGIGADDKNGIWVALQACYALPKVKVVLFRGEEIGCVGSSLAKMNFFDDCRYVLQVDRRNGDDLITSITYNMVSEKFMTDITPAMEKFGFKETNGLMTDVDTLVEKGVGISCVNMSCGYYNPHTASEYTVIHELENTLNFVIDICTNMTDRYEHKADRSIAKLANDWGFGGFGRLHYPRDWDDYGDSYYDSSYKSEPKTIGELYDEEYAMENEYEMGALEDDLTYEAQSFCNGETILTGEPSYIYYQYCDGVYNYISYEDFEKVLKRVREKFTCGEL